MRERTDMMGPPPLANLLTRWREAERRLYPLILSAPEHYERSVTLVRGVADRLGAAEEPDELAALFAAPEELLAAASAATGVCLDGLDPEAVVGAAFSLRHAELGARAKRAAAVERLASARSRGCGWAVLEESGARREDGTVVPPYHLVEARLPGIWGLHASALFDVGTDGVVYRVEAVRVDPVTASWWTDERQPIGARTHRDAVSWEASLAELRRALADA